jgi:hypothetical protein
MLLAPILTRSISISTAPSQMPTTVSLADEEAVRRILVDTLFGLWATVNNLTRLRPSRHERYRVTVFGSARTEPGHWVYEEVKQMCSAPRRRWLLSATITHAGWLRETRAREVCVRQVSEDGRLRCGRSTAPDA